MHLKRVEVENFKSFGHRLAIPFLDGFTAITGPNGSGKSNIGDAILFVLGPRSNKAIRAGKLTDLIFNGGKERKPADHCKVSLVFANEDRVIPVEADEVTLTRLVRISKSNPDAYHSLFYVNGRPSTLGEFDDLLANARISAEGYNIVRQGDVTRIVEMTPLERRRIVDQIAGITKFDGDIDRAATERGVVEQNVERVKIVLDEIERQLASLGKEREDALKYRAVKDDLDLSKAKLAVRRREALEGEIASVRASAETYEREKRELEAHLSTLQQELAGVAASIAAIEREIADKGGADAADLRAKVEALRERHVRGTERANYAANELGDLATERRALEGDLKKVTRDETKLKADRDKHAAARDEARARMDQVAAKHDAARDAVATSTTSSADLHRELAELKQTHDRVEEARTGILRERDLLAEKRDRLKVAVGEGEELLETQRFALKDVTWEISELAKDAPAEDPDALRKDLFAKKKLEAERTRELKELEPAVRRLQNEYSQLKAEQDAAENLSRGYTRAVDAVLTARDKGALKGVCGTIAELASCDPKLERAMEVAAGGRMQAIVTESDADAAAAIEFLKKERLGRATFLPLNKMAPGRPAGRPLMAVRDPEAEGFAVDLVKYDKKYQNAFWYVFRDTVIVRTLAAARKLMGGVRLVTLEGDLIDAGGAMTGGHEESRGRDRLKFGESGRAALEKVAAQLRAALDQEARLATELGELREVILSVENRLRDASRGHEDRKARLASLDARRKEAEIKLANLASDLEAKRAELQGAEIRLVEIDADLAKHATHLAALEGERETKGRLLLASTRKELAEELTKLAKSLDEAREAVRAAEALVQTREAELRLLADRRAELERRLADLDASRGRLEAMRAEETAAAEAAEKELKIVLEVEARASAALQALRGQRETQVEARTKVGARIEKARDQIQVKGDMAARERARGPALEAALAEALAEAELLPVKAPAEFAETMDELRAAVRRLEASLERLGNVNLLAIEEFDRQDARKRELAAEMERLAAQRQDLLMLVDQIVARKKEGFFKVFHEINKNFADVFARLSDGGKAELILENVDDPFQGGLVMRAQPKGKKLTRLEALSGGEKSLTSMAFIFAIQEFEPSPFYYLDEVDQNLDGINSELLARLVKHNAAHAQFILVSLRKVTLKEAEHVYGVTMQENGLSEVVGEVHISEIVDEPAPAAPEAALPGGLN